MNAVLFFSIVCLIWNMLKHYFLFIRNSNSPGHPIFSFAKPGNLIWKAVSTTGLSIHPHHLLTWSRGRVRELSWSLAGSILGPVSSKKPFKFLESSLQYGHDVCPHLLLEKIQGDKPSRGTHRALSLNSCFPGLPHLGVGRGARRRGLDHPWFPDLTHQNIIFLQA